MKISILSTLASSLLILGSAMANEWTISGHQLSQKKTAPVAVKKNKPLLIINTLNQGDQLRINLGNGKQKFGDPNILIKNGDNTYMRPRLSLTVPMATLQKVQSSKPLLVQAFTHAGTPYELTLVANPSSDLPDLKLTKTGE